MKEKKTTKKDINNKEKHQKKHTVRKVILIILIILLVLAITIGVLYYMFIYKTHQQILSQNTQAISSNEEVIEYGTHLTYENILEKLIKSELYDGTTIKISVNDTLVSKNEEYIFDKVDNITISIEASKQIVPFLNETAIVNKQIVWKVQDTKKPILSGIEDKQITEGDAFDAKTGITAKDEVDGDLEVTIEGEFDTNKPGEYILTVKAVDKNQNETKQDFKLTVNKKPEVVASSNTSSSRTTSKNSTNSGTSSSGSSSSSTSSASESTQAGRLALARAEAKRVVGRIIKAGMTKKQKATAICNYITSTVAVQSNQSNEAYKTNYGNEAYAALVLKIAACSGRCKAVTLLCDAAGLKSQHINAGQWSHQWNKIQIDDGSWVVVDAQIGFVGDKHPLE